MDRASDKLVEISGLKKHFRMRRDATLRAVDGISLAISRGESFGLVGESGCGKTTLGRLLVRLYTPTAGTIVYDGRDIHRAKGAEAKNLNRRIQMVFQDPRGSLDSRMTVSDIVAEGLDIHGLARDRRARLGQVHEALRAVGLSEEHANRYPHEFSGGQRQRIGLARALAVRPELIVADEPVSALDVSIQAQIINLMRELQREKNLTYLFISHDLSVVRHISDTIGVMYLGQLVEMADTDELYSNALHPYTQALLSAIPTPDPEIEDKRERVTLRGDVPDPVSPPSGCRFRDRCPQATETCARVEPEWREVRHHHWVSDCPCIS